jgi:hypothetical protein
MPCPVFSGEGQNDPENRLKWYPYRAECDVHEEYQGEKET